MDNDVAWLRNFRVIERRGPRFGHRQRMTSPASEHVGRSHNNKRLLTRDDKAGIEIGQNSALAAGALP
jgi:hypothetical protein